MDIQKLVVGKEYTLSHAYGQPSQTVRVLSVEEKQCRIDGKYLSAEVIYTSDDGSKGLRSSLNKIECERYLHERIQSE